MNNFIQNLLGIEDENVIIDDYFTDNATNTLVVQISLKRTQQICPQCGSIHTHIHSHHQKKIIHSNFTSQKCILLYNQKRYECLDCEATFLETNYFALRHNRISDVTLNCILKDLKTTDSYLNIANRYNVTSQTVLNYMDKYINPKRRCLPEVLCIDEFKNLSHGKGKYACLLLNYQTGEIIDVLPNRRQEYLQYYFNHISQEERRNVKFLVSDMYDGYKYLSSAIFPNSTLVIDAFHYIKYITEAFNKVRRRIQKMFNNNSLEYKQLKKYWKLLSKDASKLENKTQKWLYFKGEHSTFEIIQCLKNIHPDIKTAYLLKEDFFSSYKKTNFNQANAYLHTLINSMINTNLPEFIEVANTFKHWFPYIVNSFNKDEYGKRMSNGKIEGSNNKIKVIKRVSYGYSDFYHLRNRIMYIFNDNEKPLPFLLNINKIKDTNKLFYKPRKKYEKRSNSQESDLI